MSNFLWVEEFRPKKVANCILPEKIKEIFQGFVDDGQIPNLLLSGGAGIGKTTDAKAKELRGFVDRLVTYAKKDDVHGRRLIRKKIHGNLSKHISNVLVDEIAPNYSDRNGGYTRIIKLDNRKNDNAPVSLVEFVGLSHLVNDEDGSEEDKKD